MEHASSVPASFLRLEPEPITAHWARLVSQHSRDASSASFGRTLSLKVILRGHPFSGSSRAPVSAAISRSCGVGAATGCDLLVPFTGFTIIAYVLIHMATPAKIAGVSWLVIGAAVLIVSTRRSVMARPNG